MGISEEGTASGSTQANTSLTITQTYWYASMIANNFGEGYNVLKTTKLYWVASRYVACDSTSASFGLRCVGSSNFYGDPLFTSYGGVYIRRR